MCSKRHIYHHLHCQMKWVVFLPSILITVSWPSCSLYKCFPSYVQYLVSVLSPPVRWNKWPSRRRAEEERAEGFDHPASLLTSAAWPLHRSECTHTQLGCHAVYVNLIYPAAFYSVSTYWPICVGFCCTSAAFTYTDTNTEQESRHKSYPSASQNFMHTYACKYPKEHEFQGNRNLNVD